MSRKNIIMIVIGVVLLVSVAACSGMYAPENATDEEQNQSAAPANVNIRVVSNSVAPVRAGFAQQAPTPTPVPVEFYDQARTFETVLINIYERVNPSVVNIEVVDEFSNNDSIDSSGSGFVFDADGNIVTNAHVVIGAREILVTFFNGVVAEAEVVGYDDYSDLAVIRVEDVPEGTLFPVQLGDSNNLRVGQFIVAIGNPFGLDSSMTTGIISATGRTLRSQQLINPLTDQVYSNPAIIQIDAAVNPGNSGGPILDLNGNVVGVATAIRSETGIFQGVAYAVPVNTLQRVIPQLIEKGVAVYPWLGVSAAPTDEPGLSMPVLAQAFNLPVDRGVMIASVLPNSPAFNAGLQGGNSTQLFRGIPISIGGDIIVAIDNTFINDLDELLSYLVENTSPNQEVILTVVRGDQTLEVPLTLGERPSTSD